MHVKKYGSYSGILDSVNVVSGMGCFMLIDRNTYLDEGGTTEERSMGGREEGGLANACEKFESYGGHLVECQCSILDGVYYASKYLS